MSDIDIGVIGFVALFVLLALRMPVATAMMLVGFVGHLVLNERGALPTLAGETFHIPHMLSLTIFMMPRILGLVIGEAGWLHQRSSVVPASQRCQARRWHRR
jgi:hypothetical protein